MLPAAAPQLSHSVSRAQGIDGSLTHFFAGSHHAVDFRCAVGTPLLAVAGGQVVDIQQNNSVSGVHVSNLFKWNSVMLALDDGAFVEYVHLRAQSVTVQLGERVLCGQKVPSQPLPESPQHPHTEEGSRQRGWGHQLLPIHGLTGWGGFADRRVRRRRVQPRAAPPPSGEPSRLPLLAPPGRNQSQAVCVCDPQLAHWFPPLNAETAGLVSDAHVPRPRGRHDEVRAAGRGWRELLSRGGETLHICRRRGGLNDRVDPLSTG
jgi:hypothetical protein